MPDVSTLLTKVRVLGFCCLLRTIVQKRILLELCMFLETKKLFSSVITTCAPLVPSLLHPHCVVFSYTKGKGLFAVLYCVGILKLYCRYLYTRHCMINHIWGLKQLWLQVNGHAWFHLQRLRWPVRNREGAKNSKWKYMSPAGFEPTPRQSTTGKSAQRLRPLGHEGLMVISGLMSNRIMGYKFKKKLLRDNTRQLDYGYMCIWTECQTKLSFLISL